MLYYYYTIQQVTDMKKEKQFITQFITPFQYEYKALGKQLKQHLYYNK